MNEAHTDFEGNELRLGDEVLTVDLEKKGGQLRRGEVIKLCPTSVKIRVQRNHQKYGNQGEGDILRGNLWISLVKRNPAREAELLAPKNDVLEL